MNKKIIIAILTFLAIAITAVMLIHEKNNKKIINEKTILTLNVYKNNDLAHPFNKTDDILITTYSNQSTNDLAMIQKIYKIIIENSGPFFDKDCDCLFIPYFRLEFLDDEKAIDVYLDGHYFIAKQNGQEIKRGTYYDNTKNNINEIFDLLKLKMWE